MLRKLALAATSPAQPLHQPLRMLHSADWQIGKPYARVLDPDKRARLRQVRFAAIGRLAELVQSQGADLVVVAGDLFDSPTPNSADVSAVCAAIGKIACPVLAIPGNHDHGAPGSVWHSPFFQAERQRRAENLTVLLELSPFEVAGAVVLPCPLLRRNDSSDPCGWLHSLDWQGLPADKPRLVLAHGSVHGFGAGELDAHANNRLRLEGPWLDAVDYLALGDWHGLKQVSAKAWYSGTPEPDRFPRSADYQSGYVLQVDLLRGQMPQVTPLATGCLGWHPLPFHCQDDSDLARLETQLDELLGQRVGADLLLLEISGSLSLAGQQAYSQLLERVEAQVLRLKLRGHCSVAPGAAELAELTQRPGDPLVAQVASNLKNSASAQEAAPDGGDAVARLALAELYRAVHLAEQQLAGNPP
ncbi:exonuclease SbcCD subunit D [Cyanobium sp. HWJ4-Hawea]|uniref:metallophosphoesterase family protein n=1 Tax=Cyanobium sp. HWJ4-Hawea TaxID=2823713 RepID=UPI0020CDB9B5|nr:DNA repair exonuclease [Cyanobium sp. HWJ4-Hawea]